MFGEHRQPSDAHQTPRQLWKDAGRACRRKVSALCCPHSQGAGDTGLCSNAALPGGWRPHDALQLPCRPGCLAERGAGPAGGPAAGEVAGPAQQAAVSQLPMRCDGACVSLAPAGVLRKGDPSSQAGGLAAASAPGQEPAWWLETRTAPVCRLRTSVRAPADAAVSISKSAPAHNT